MNEIYNKDERPPHAPCVENNPPKDDWKCMLAVHTLEHHDSKFLWILPQYDHFSLKHMFGVQCMSEGEAFVSL